MKLATQSGKFLLWGLGALLFGTLLFSLSVSDGHLGLDDWGYIYGCPFVRKGVSWEGFLRACSDPGHGAIWMPLTFLSYMTDLSWWGGGWPVHHAVNVAWHLINAGLVFFFLQFLFRHGPYTFPSFSATRLFGLSLFAALAWAIHPLRVESVAFVASRKEEMWFFFTLLGLFAWSHAKPRGGFIAPLLAYLAMGAACMSKPTAVCFPFLVMLVDFWLGRFAKRRFLYYAAFLFLACLTGLLTLYSQAHPTGAEETNLFAQTFDWRVLNAAVSTGRFLTMFFWPAGLHFDYRAVFGACPLHAVEGLIALGVSVALVLAGLIWGSSRVRKTLIFSVGWFAFSLFPVLGIFGYVNGDQAFADRYTYVPAFAFSVLLVVGLNRCVPVNSSRVRRWGWALVGGGVLIAWTIVTARLLPTYHNDETTYRRVLACDPHHWRALRVVGNEECARQGEMAQGLAKLRLSLKLRPSARTAASLAYLLAIRGEKADLAEVHTLGAAIAKNPALDRSGLFLDALAIVALKEQRYADAARYYQAALTAPARGHSPGFSLLNLAIAWIRLGETPRAYDLLDELTKSPESSVSQHARRIRRALESGQTDWEWIGE